MNNGEIIKLEIDGRLVEAPSGVTVHRAAEINGIYIPTLCSHKDLSPFGGCRMCIVEIDSIRGYPLSCNTTAVSGMKVLTDTEAVRDIRREVLQLILSEHPSSCLICDEADECREFSGTVRKSGVATGCRYCPNDRQCELQDLVEKLEITEVHYPILYKGYEAERQDPFFDRDYNICILCGRCVRMCQEMRGTGVLAFNFRGPTARIDTAFGKSHIETGCEFCGACVSVCPTGALAEKASKWDGKPDGSVTTTCPYCAIGCQMDYWHKNDKFSMATPVLDSEVNDGQACVKGRFCVGEVTHHFDRGRKPFAREGNYWKEKTWDEALDIAVSKLRGLNPGEFSMLVSPDCTNESLYAAQKFARMAIGTNSIDSTARITLGGGIPFWVKLFSKPLPIQEIKSASRIIAVGLDTRFSFSIIGVEIRKALQKGTKLITIGPRESNLARYADIWLQPSPGYEGTILKALGKRTRKACKDAAKISGMASSELEATLDLLKSGDDVTVILGPSVFRYSALGNLIEAIELFLKRKKTTIIPLYTGTNTRGAIELGVFPEILPGPASVEDSEATEQLGKLWGGDLPDDKGISFNEIINDEKRPKVLYFVGVHPTFERPDCDFLIVQDIFEPDFECDLYLPAASFIESEGTLVNVGGRVQEAPRLEKLPDSVMYGRARPDWWIFSEIAKKLGAAGFEFETAKDVLKEISMVVPNFPGPGKLNRKKRKISITKELPYEKQNEFAAIPARGNFLLALRPMGYTHRGTSITSKVEGLGIIDPENGFFISQEDADALGVVEGQEIAVVAGSVEGTGKARIEPELQKGVIYLYVPDSFGGLADRKGLEGLYRLEQNPVHVEVRVDGV